VATSEQGFVDHLIGEEIRRMVADAVQNGGTISAQQCAQQILRAYNSCGLSEADVANRLMMAAASAGVAVAFGLHSAQLTRPVAGADNG